MTAKKPMKRKAPSTAELKRQIAHERSQSDNSAAQMGELTELVKKALEGQAILANQVEELSRTPTREQMLKQHDQSERVVNDVLRFDVGEEGFPELPPDADELPHHLKKIKEQLARNRPIERFDSLDAGQEDIGQYRERPMDSTGPAKDMLAPLVAEDTSIALESGKMFSKEKYEVEMFMNEMVLIRVHDTTDETQVQIPEAINNGRRQFYVRGQMQWVRRYSLEPLARAKKTTYSQRKIRDENDVEKYINIPHTALMYPFEVLKDTDRGKAWLRHILAEAY